MGGRPQTGSTPPFILRPPLSQCQAISTGWLRPMIFPPTPFAQFPTTALRCRLRRSNSPAPCFLLADWRRPIAGRFQTHDNESASHASEPEVTEPERRALRSLIDQRRRAKLAPLQEAFAGIYFCGGCLQDIDEWTPGCETCGHRFGRQRRSGTCSPQRYRELRARIDENRYDAMRTSAQRIGKIRHKAPS